MLNSGIGVQGVLNTPCTPIRVKRGSPDLDGQDCLSGATRDREDMWAWGDDPLHGQRIGGRRRQPKHEPETDAVQLF